MTLGFISATYTGILSSLDVNLAQPRCSRVGLVLTTGWGTWHSLRVGGVGRGSVEGEGGGEGMGIWIDIFLSNNKKRKKNAL